jgi:7-cyano-7-deazaguanine reductase
MPKTEIHAFKPARSQGRAPKFDRLIIHYMPRDRCWQMKSLKEYLFSYRNLGIFQENVVNQVLEDVVKACDPVWAVVRGELRTRGGMG